MRTAGGRPGDCSLSDPGAREATHSRKNRDGLGNSAGNLLPPETTSSFHKGGIVKLGFGAFLFIVPCSLAVYHTNFSFFLQEQFVLVELSGIIDSDFLSKCENKCKILVSLRIWGML